MSSSTGLVDREEERGQEDREKTMVERHECPQHDASNCGFIV